MPDLTTANAWWESLKEIERAMWIRVSSGHDSASAFELYERDKADIRHARSSGSAACDRAIGKSHNPYDLHAQPHLRFYWDWLYDETWAHR